MGEFCLMVELAQGGSATNGAIPSSSCSIAEAVLSICSKTWLCRALIRSACWPLDTVAVCLLHREFLRACGDVMLAFTVQAPEYNTIMIEDINRALAKVGTEVRLSQTTPSRLKRTLRILLTDGYLKVKAKRGNLNLCGISECHFCLLCKDFLLWEISWCKSTCSTILTLSLLVLQAYLNLEKKINIYIYKNHNKIK